jgi:hypothetical protein
MYTVPSPGPKAPSTRPHDQFGSPIPKPKFSEVLHVAAKYQTLAPFQRSLTRRDGSLGAVADSSFHSRRSDLSQASSVSDRFSYFAIAAVRTCVLKKPPFVFSMTC